MSDNYFRVVVLYFCFIAFLTFFSAVFDVQLAQADIDAFKANQDDLIAPNDPIKQALGWVFDIVGSVPVINIFVPLLRIMTFSYVSVPAFFVIFLDLSVVLGGLVVYRLVRG